MAFDPKAAREPTVVNVRACEKFDIGCGEDGKTFAMSFTPHGEPEAVSFLLTQRQMEIVQEKIADSMAFAETLRKN